MFNIRVKSKVGKAKRRMLPGAHKLSKAKSLIAKPALQRVEVTP